MVTTTHDNAFGPRKTVVILAVVAGCFAVLWPKIFYPMLIASYAPPPSADSTGCCDVIFESDVTAVDIMQELCHNIIRHHQVDPRVRDAIETSKFNKLSPSSASLCREEVLARCGIDLSSFLAEKERLKKSYKQVLEEIRGFNGSFCLKMQFGVPLSRLGTPHLIRYHILMPHSTIKQERATPPHAGNYHPALRERGRAIPSSHIVPNIQDRPDHVQPMKMRPPMGAGHMVSTPKGNGSMGILMPLYTVGIVIFFIYTISKVLMGIIMPLYTIGNVVSLLYKVLQLLRKSSDSEILRREYSTDAAEREYQKLVFNPEIFASAVTASSKAHCEKKEQRPDTPEEPVPSMEELKEPAGDIEIDQLRRRLVETEAAMERIVAQMSNLSRSVVNCSTPTPESKESSISEETPDHVDKELEELHETPTVRVVNMEMTASCEGGRRSRPSTPILVPQCPTEDREKTPPISIYLEGALPSQCELLVTDSKTQEILEEDENVEVPVVLSGKMTLSLISLDQVAAESPQDDQFESTATRKVTSSKQENSPVDVHKKRLEKSDDKHQEAKDSYESGSDESGEISDYDNLDSNTDLLNNQKSIVKKFIESEKLSSKNSVSNSDEEDSETDDYRQDYERNVALLKTIQREKNRRLERMKDNNDSEEENEDEEDEEEEEFDDEEDEFEEEEEEEDDDEQVEEVETQEEYEEDGDELEDEVSEEEDEEFEEEEDEEEEEEEEEGEEEEDEEVEEEETDDKETMKKSQEIKIEHSKNATSFKNK
ncbi:uncharacterized protein LOC106639504 isoform X3 [Copidosoma floridanum]|uniref:uncharacterized protein LOC106639504 isoform X3 n=1 Tax=Copidosoma floridanum TaxID=29053 RepID=UPI0006C94409|nr:uncharacterized protein LOC106639504 isoform X3 [Copidosoma floridanum]